MCFRYITETLNREREPASTAHLTSSIGSLFSGTYDLSATPQSPSFPPSRNMSPAQAAVRLPSLNTYLLNSPPRRHTRSPSSSADPYERCSSSQRPQAHYHTETTPYSSASRTESNLSEFHGSNYRRSPSIAQTDGFSFAASTYSGNESRARPDSGMSLHQSSHSRSSSHSFDTANASTSSLGYSQDPQYNDGGRVGHSY